MGVQKQVCEGSPLSELELDLSTGKGDWKAFYRLLLRPKGGDGPRLLLSVVPTAILDADGKIDLFVFTNRDGLVVRKRKPKAALLLDFLPCLRRGRSMSSQSMTTLVDNNAQHQVVGTQCFKSIGPASLTSQDVLTLHRRMGAVGAFGEREESFEIDDWPLVVAAKAQVLDRSHPNVRVTLQQTSAGVQIRAAGKPKRETRLIATRAMARINQFILLNTSYQLVRLVAEFAVSSVANNDSSISHKPSFLVCTVLLFHEVHLRPVSELTGESEKVESLVKGGPRCDSSPVAAGSAMASSAGPTKRPSTATARARIALNVVRVGKWRKLATEGEIVAAWEESQDGIVGGEYIEQHQERGEERDHHHHKQQHQQQQQQICTTRVSACTDGTAAALNPRVARSLPLPFARVAEVEPAAEAEMEAAAVV
jgi:hypothetical protein